MTSFKNKLNRNKDKITGEVKEATGKITGNEQLELKGKIQSAQGNIKKNMNVSENIEEIKESIAGKINDNIDKRKAKK